MSIGNLMVDNVNELFCENIDCENIDLVTINGLPYNAGAVSADACYLRNANLIGAPLIVGLQDPIKFITSTVSGGITYNTLTGIITVANIGFYDIEWAYHTGTSSSETTLFMNGVSMGASFRTGTNYNAINAFEFVGRLRVLLATPFVNSTFEIRNTFAANLELAPSDFAKQSVYASIVIRRVL